jgi:hypothetical protein
MQVTDFIDAGGFLQCPVSAFAEFRQATPTVREETLGVRETLLQISLRLFGGQLWARNLAT